MKCVVNACLLAGLLLMIGTSCSSSSGPGAPATANQPPPTNTDTSKNLSAPNALQELKAGNQRFISGNVVSGANLPNTRSGLTRGQAPDAIILSCSDSRVPPEQVFDLGLGKLFVVRLAGDVLNADAIASIEYAVVHLGTHLIVVMGHTACGAVKAAIDTPPGADAGSPSLNQLLAQIRQNLGDTASLPPDPTLRQPVMTNVSAVAQELLSGSAIIQNAVSSGQLQIEDAIYDLGSGQVEFWQ